MSFFIEKNYLKCLYELQDIEDNMDIIYYHFMNNNDEICYILNHGNIYGIITIGDMCRYYRGEKKGSCINQNFSYVKTSNDYESAHIIFSRIRTISEVPVISDKKLIGIIKNEKENSLYSIEKKRIWLREQRMGKYCWYDKEIRTLCKEIKANVYFYNTPSGKIELLNLSENEKEILFHKIKYPNGRKGLLMMTEIEQRAFWGENYTENYIEEFCNSYERINGIVKDGIYKID